MRLLKLILWIGTTIPGTAPVLAEIIPCPRDVQINPTGSEKTATIALRGTATSSENAPFHFSGEMQKIEGKDLTINGSPLMLSTSGQAGEFILSCFYSNPHGRGQVSLSTTVDKFRSCVGDPNTWAFKCE